MPPENEGQASNDQNQNQTSLATFSDDDFKGLMAQGSFMGYIRFYTGKAKEVAAEKIPINHWGFVQGQTITDLGDSVDAYPLAWRPRAFKISPLEIRFNFNSERFKQLAQESEGQNSGVMVGPEFLLYVPKVKEFVTYHACGFNSKEDAKTLLTLLKNGTAVNIGKKTVTQGKFTNVVPNSKPTQSIGDKPADDVIAAKIQAFLNQPDKEPEQEAQPVAAGERPR